MTTSSDLPPHELRGALGTLIDAGGGSVPLLERPPVPNAAISSPGLATGAATSPTIPTIPSEDPGAVALAIARIAGELFGGQVAPGYAPSMSLPTLGGAPGSPGIAPMPSAPITPTPAITAPLPTASAIQPIAPTLVPTAPPLPIAPTPVPSVQVNPGDPGVASIPTDLGPFSPSSFDPLPSFGTDEPLRIPMIESVPATEIRESKIRDLGGKPFDPNEVRRDFPILDERVHGKRLVWLDNAATTQKPRAVIDRLSHFYTHENSNVHRGAHTLAARATDAYEQARETVREFLGASSAREIVFVRGATEGINLIAQSWGRRNVGAGDEIVITHLEHHANIVPWQQLCAETGARLRIAPVDDRGDILLDDYERLLGRRTRLVAFPQVSNALGTVTPTREMIEIAHRYGVPVMVDGAQAVSHMAVDVGALDCDFYVFSGHKVFAPTGIGVVFGKREILAAMPPWQGGGNMIQDVTFERTSYQPPPGRFEAGTGSIGDAAGLGTALDYIMKIGMDTIDRYEHELLVYATERLGSVPGLTMIGTAPHKAGVLSFVLDGQRTEDVGAALDQEGIAVRSGHHCAQPILRRFGLESTVRASLAFYNVCEDIDDLVAALLRMQSHRA